MPADDVGCRRPTEQADAADSGGNAERSSSSPKMYALLDTIASYSDRGGFDPSIGVAGVLFRLGLLLLRLAETTALVFQEPIYGCVPDILRSARGQPFNAAFANSREQVGP